VREPLIWLGQGDPVQSMHQSFDDDPDTEILIALMDAWPSSQTDWTCAELIAEAERTNLKAHQLGRPGLAAALLPIASDRRGKLDSLTLSHFLRKHKDIIVGGRKISQQLAMTRTGTVRWVLIRV
jgi:hypothetical protein